MVVRKGKMPKMKMKQMIPALLVAASLGSGAASAGEAERETGIVVLSFISPVARESHESYDYRSNKNSGDTKNYPLPLIRLPEQSRLYGQEGYLSLERKAADAHLKRIREAGFDLVFYDMLPIPDYDPAKPLTFTNEPFYYFSNYFEWLKGAEKHGLKLGIFADVANQSARYPNYRYITKDEWVKILRGALKLIPDSSAVWRVNGLPGIMHFQTDCVYVPSASPVPGAPMPDGGWRQVWKELREGGDDFYFVSDLRPHDKDAQWSGLTDAAYLFAPASPASFLPEYQTDIAARLGRTPFYWTQSCGYYIPRRIYTQPDFRRIDDTFRAAMKSGARKIVTLTWNDLGEDHDIWPSVNKGSELLEIVAYYNAWFKSGKQPAIAQEKIVIAYPLRTPAEVAAQAPAYGGNRWVAPAFTPKLFYWSLLKEPKCVTVGGKVLNLPAGLSLGEFPLDAGNDPAEIPMSAQLDGRTVNLPAVMKTAAESRNGSGGLEHRYIDLLKASASNALTGTEVYCDLANGPECSGKITAAGAAKKVEFQVRKGIHNWLFLRGNLPENAVPPDVRFLRLAYRGSLPAGTALNCVLQQDGNRSFAFSKLPAPEKDRSVRLLIPLNHFRRTGWSGPAPLEIPTPDRIRWVHLGPAGTPSQDGSGELLVEEMSFLY